MPKHKIYKIYNIILILNAEVGNDLKKGKKKKNLDESLELIDEEKREAKYLKQPEILC